MSQKKPASAARVVNPESRYAEWCDTFGYASAAFYDVADADTDIETTAGMMPRQMAMEVARNLRKVASVKAVEVVACPTDNKFAAVHWVEPIDAAEDIDDREADIANAAWRHYRDKHPDTADDDREEALGMAPETDAEFPDSLAALLGLV